MSNLKFKTALFSALAVMSNAAFAGQEVDNRSQYIAPYGGNNIVIDGNQDEHVWQLANWQPIDNQWLGDKDSEKDFQGQYKVLWSPAKLYVLVEIVDDTLIEKSELNVNPFLTGDGLKVFIDEDASGGLHQFDKNANVYHVTLKNEALMVDEPNHVVYYSQNINSEWTEQSGKYTWEMAIDIYPDSASNDNSIDEKAKLFGGKNMGLMIAYSDDDGSEQSKGLVGSERLSIEQHQKNWVNASSFGKLLLSK